MATAERIGSRLELTDRRRQVGRPGAVPRRDLRTCAHCGAHVPFIRDASGGWATCTACGQYA